MLVLGGTRVPCAQESGPARPSRLVLQELLPEGRMRVVYAPEFRGVPPLLEELQALQDDPAVAIKTPEEAQAVPPVKGGSLRIEGAGPWVDVPKVRGRAQPRVPSRIFLAGPERVVRRALQHLHRFDQVPRGVAVSLLVAEVAWRRDLAKGAQFLYDKDAAPNPKETIFRSGATSFEPDAFLGATLTGFRPFQGTSYRFRDPNTLGGAWEYTLRLLLQRGEADFMAWPNLQVAEGAQGVVESIERIPQFGISGATSFPVARRLAEETVGVRLRARPFRVGREEAVLDLDLWLRVPEVLPGPDAEIGRDVLRTRTLTTRLALRDGEPILMGGVFLRRATGKTKSLPGAHRIKALEALGNARDRSCVETELMVLVRAHILEPGRRHRPIETVCPGPHALPPADGHGRGPIHPNTPIRGWRRDHPGR